MFGRGWMYWRAGSSTGRTEVEYNTSKGPPITSLLLSVSPSPDMRRSSSASASFGACCARGLSHLVPPCATFLASNLAHAAATPVLTARIRSGRSTMVPMSSFRA